MYFNDRIGHTWIRGNYPVGGSDLPLRENDTTVAELLQVYIECYCR